MTFKTVQFDVFFTGKMGEMDVKKGEKATRILKCYAFPKMQGKKMRMNSPRGAFFSFRGVRGNFLFIAKKKSSP